MKKPMINRIDSESEWQELDHLLWEVLWKPIDLPRDFRESIELESKNIEFVVSSGNELLGGLVANRISEDTVELRHIALLPTAQGKGIGRRLIQYLINELKQEHCSFIETTARNTSIGFFKKVGFTELSGDNVVHPLFLQHGITFTRMQCKI
jgi:N-acetylglutamate synthase-like GNAT family acetyltransferase